jgi:hypothetical protein
MHFKKVKNYGQWYSLYSFSWLLLCVGSSGVAAVKDSCLQWWRIIGFWVSRGPCSTFCPVVHDLWGALVVLRYVLHGILFSNTAWPHPIFWWRGLVFGHTRWLGKCGGRVGQGMTYHVTILIHFYFDAGDDSCAVWGQSRFKGTAPNYISIFIAKEILH